MMNTWVEYFIRPITEQTTWVKPDPSTISRRFFDKKEEAAEFAKRMCAKGYHAKIKTDGSY